MDLVTVCLASCAITLACVYLHRHLRRPHNFPPGPTFFPLVGNVFLLKEIMKKEKFQHKAFEVLSEKYNTSILGLKLGQNLTVVVSGIKLVHQVFTQEEFEARPDSFFIRLRCMGTRNGITCTDGALWNEQRAFVLRHLRQISNNKHSIENILQSELSELKRSLSASTYTNKIRLGPYLATAILNVLWTMVAGSRLSCSNFYLEKMLKLMEKRTRLFDMSGGLLNHIPWLRFIAPNFTGYNLILNINQELKALFQEVILDHEKSYDPKITRDLIDAFLHQRTSSKYSNFYKEDQLIMVCLDLFIAGSQTTSNTLDFALLSVLVNPQIQDKVQQEIWSVIGQNESPNLHHKTQMPYVEAVLMEVYRFCQVTPVAGPRRALKDTVLNGYKIPKDTSILINLHSVHMDLNEWEDPEVFRPERFLTPDGHIVSHGHLIPFGLGRRRCLGEVLARSSIFLLFIGILQHYYIEPADGERGLEIHPVPGMTMAPCPYYVKLTPVLKAD